MLRSKSTVHKNSQIHHTTQGCLELASCHRREIHPKGSNWAGNLGYHGTKAIEMGHSSFTWQCEWPALVKVHIAFYISLRDDYCGHRILSYPEIMWNSSKARHSCSNYMPKHKNHQWHLQHAQLQHTQKVCCLELVHC